MTKRRSTLEAVLFLPAMAVLAVAVFAGMAAVIYAGGWLLRGWFGLLASFGLPRSAALALAVIFAAFTVYGLVALAGYVRRKAKLKA